MNYLALEKYKNKITIKTLIQMRGDILTKLTSCTDFEIAQELRREYSNLTIKINAEKALISGKWKQKDSTYTVNSPDGRKNRMQN